MTKDAATYRAEHPEYRHREVPWTPGQTLHLLAMWRALLESQNGDGVDGCEFPEDGGAVGWALREFVTVGSKVLILGAGRGQEVDFARRSGYDATGFTLGSMNPEVAREEFGLSLHFCDAHCSMLPSRSFDAVLGMQVLEHSPAPLLLLLECARLLKPGGIAVFETPASSAHTGGRSLHHVLCPTPTQAAGLFEKAGFVDIRQFNVSIPLTAAEMDQGDVPFLRTMGRRASDAELNLFDPATRQIVAS